MALAGVSKEEVLAISTPLWTATQTFLSSISQAYASTLQMASTQLDDVGSKSDIEPRVRKEVRSLLQRLYKKFL